MADVTERDRTPPRLPRWFVRYWLAWFIAINLVLIWVTR